MVNWETFATAVGVLISVFTALLVAIFAAMRVRGQDAVAAAQNERSDVLIKQRIDHEVEISEVKRLQERVGGLENQIGTLLAATLKLHERINELQSSNSGFIGQVAELKARIAEFVIEVVGLKKEREELKTQIEKLEKTISSLLASIEAKDDLAIAAAKNLDG